MSSTHANDCEHPTPHEWGTVQQRLNQEIWISGDCASDGVGDPTIRLMWVQGSGGSEIVRAHHFDIDNARKLRDALDAAVSHYDALLTGACDGCGRSTFAEATLCLDCELHHAQEPLLHIVE